MKAFGFDRYGIPSDVLELACRCSPGSRWACDRTPPTRTPPG